MKKRIKKDIDLRCASSIDEMIKKIFRYNISECRTTIRLKKSYARS